MMRAAIVLAIGLAVAMPLKAQAAVTKTILLACKDEADLRKLPRNFAPAEAIASPPLSSRPAKRPAAAASRSRATLSSASISASRRWCAFASSGGLDCYWTVLSAIDEYLTKPVAPKEPPAPKKNP
jgi:hypothetical protein